MPSIEEVKEWRGRNAVGPNEDKLGSIEDIYLDEDTGKPEWVALKTGLFGGNLSFAPLAEAKEHGEHIHLPYTKDQVKDSPNVDADGKLSQEEEAALYKHYGLEYGENRSDSGLAEGQRDERPAVGRDTSGPTTNDAMTRSEEELRVGKTQREVGKARLRKYTVTENVTKTVPVQREEVRIEREPITDANVGDALDGPDLSEEEHEVTLHAEEVVVDKDVVAKERVRLDKDTVVENREVSEEVRKEVIDADTGEGEGTSRN
jgi:uncharacterized protein (TIGR02271 family)